MDASKNLNGFGTWRRYKLGQAQFTSWLKQTAEKLVARKPKPEPNNGNGDAESQQSPGQKKKKKKAKQPAVGLNFDTETDKSVHWSQLEVLAQRIADNAEPEDVPESAVNILRDVVGLRKKSFKFFSRATKDSNDEKVKQSNANHAHIITVLEQVLAKLEAFVSAKGSSGRKESKANAQINTSDLTNMFSYLEVHTGVDPTGEAVDEVESGDEAASIRTRQSQRSSKKKKTGNRAKKPKKAEKPLEKSSAKANNGPSWVDKIDFGLADEDEEDDEFDLYMMVYCFFEDFNSIRNHIAERWCDYWYDRSVSLNTLAVITNAAFELFHQLEHDLVKELRPVHPDLAKYDFMMNMLFIQYGIDHIDYDSYDDLSNEESEERIWRDESDWLGLSSCFALQRALGQIPLGKVPMLAPSQRKPTVYGANKLSEWREFEDSIAMQIITEGAHLKALKKNEQEPPFLPSESQLLLDFEECLRKYDYNSALVFSLHVWVDIRNIIETEHVRPFEQLQLSAARLKQALEAHNPNKFSKDHTFKRRWIARIWETKHYMLEDFMLEDKKARFRQVGLEEDPAPFFLLKHEPVWAGLLDFRAKLVYSQLGHEFIMLSPTVNAAAYLYHAALAVDPSLPRWEGMAKYLDTYVDGSQFKLGLQAGQTPAAIIRNFEKLPSIPHGQGSITIPGLEEANKMWTTPIRIRQSLYERYCFDYNRLPSHIFPEYLLEIAAHRPRVEQKPSTRDQTQNGDAINSPPDATSQYAQQIGNGDAKAHFRVMKTALRNAEEARRNALAQISPLEMLQILDEAVTTQVEPLFELDYFELFDDAVALLKAVCAALGSLKGDDLRSLMGDETGVRLGRLPVLLGVVLDECEGPGQEGELWEGVVRGCGEMLRGREGSA